MHHPQIESLIQQLQSPSLSEPVDAAFETGM
jgi:hypothetical protein